MKNKKFLIGVVLVLFTVASIAFASGQSEYSGCCCHDGGMRGARADGRGMYDNFSEEEVVTLTGQFSWGDSEFPAIVDSAGKTSYLIIAGNVQESNIPEEGTDITATAYPSSLSPVHFVVTSAMVNGEEIITPSRKWERKINRRNNS